MTVNILRSRIEFQLKLIHKFSSIHELNESYAVRLNKVCAVPNQKEKILSNQTVDSYGWPH